MTTMKTCVQYFLEKDVEHWIYSFFLNGSSFVFIIIFKMKEASLILLHSSNDRALSSSVDDAHLFIDDASLPNVFLEKYLFNWHHCWWYKDDRLAWYFVFMNFIFFSDIWMPCHNTSKVGISYATNSCKEMQ